MPRPQPPFCEHSGWPLQEQPPKATPRAEWSRCGSVPPGEPQPQGSHPIFNLSPSPLSQLPSPGLTSLPRPEPLQAAPFLLPSVRPVPGPKFPSPLRVTVSAEPRTPYPSPSPCLPHAGGPHPSASACPPPILVSRPLRQLHTPRPLPDLLSPGSPAPSPLRV
eukprot:934559-Rhodomonas_salina.1